MTVQPAIIYFAGEPTPTAAQQSVWWRANLNAALVFERMVGRAPRVTGTTAIVIRSAETLRQDVAVNDNTSIWDQVMRAVAPYLDAGQFLSVVVPGITAGGGKAAPLPFRGWYHPGEPGDGGLVVIGGRHLRGLERVGDPRWTPAQRRAYFINIWLIVHEWLHVAACPHYRGDPRLTQYARTTLTNYGSRIYWLGLTQTGGGYEMMTTVGVMREELAAVRASPLWDFEPTAEYLRVYITDRERMINRGYPPYQVMGTGLATQEYRA